MHSPAARSTDTTNRFDRLVIERLCALKRNLLELRNAALPLAGWGAILATPTVIFSLYAIAVILLVLWALGGGFRPQPAVCERQVPGSPLSSAKRASLVRPCALPKILSD